MNAARLIGVRIREAREAAGLTQGDLADRLGGMSQTAVSYWESGKRSPSFDDLYRIAALLGVGISEILPSDPPREPIRAILRAETARLDLAEISKPLEDFLDKAETLPRPAEEIHVDADEPIRAAQQLLSKAKLLEPPVDVNRLAKRCGIRVLPWPFDQALSGLLIELEEGPIIGVNSSHPRTRQRFTLAHELAHHLLRHHGGFHIDLGVPAGDGNPPGFDWRHERQANDFAANLLMPAAWIRQRFDANPSAQQLAHEFKVSPIAMGYRLTALGLR